MKKMKVVLCILLACAMLALTACQSGGEQGVQGEGGRYVETDITPPEAEGQSLKSFVGPDGTIRCYTDGLKDCYTSEDNGESWTRTDGPGAGSEAFVNLWNYTLLEDGNILGALVDKETMRLESLAKILPDGSTEPYPVAELDEMIAAGKEVSIIQLQALPGNRLLLGYASGMNAVRIDGDEGEEANPEEGAAVEEGTAEDAAAPDASVAEGGDDAQSFSVGGSGGEGFTEKTALYDLETGKEVVDLTASMTLSSTADGENLYLLDYEGKITARKLEDGSPVAGYEANIPIDEFVFNIAINAGEKGSLISSDGKQLMKISSEGTETLLNGGAYSFSAPNLSLESVGLLSDGGIVVTLGGSNGSKLYKYAWDPDAKTDPAKTLKVWSLKDNATLRAAFSALRAKDPDITIDYEVAMAEDGMTTEDAIKNLNTRLVGGDGPDVILLDGCPADSFAGKGVLADLTDLLDTSAMAQNLKTPFEKENGLFYLPMNLKIPALAGTKDQLDVKTLEDLVKKVEAGKEQPSGSADQSDPFNALPEEDRPALAFESIEELFDLLWNSSASGIINSEGLNTDALRTFLDSLQRIDKKYALGESEQSMGAVAFSTDGDEGGVIQGSPISYAMGRALLGGATVGDLVNTQFILSPPDSEITSFPGLTEGAWLPTTLAGINADSEKKELAAELLGTMLGDSVQGARSGSGLPVTEKGLENQVKKLRDLMENEEGADADSIPDIDLSSLISSLKEPVLEETVLKETILEAAEKLCAGELDLEGAVSQIEQNVKTYLAERQ